MKPSDSTIPLLFLDIDGVMNMTGGCLRNRSGEVFEPEAVIALRWLVRRTGAQVVVTSTRRRAGLAAMQALFSRNDLADVAKRIIGHTPILVTYDTDELREEEITQWLETHPSCGRVVVLDDKPLAQPLAARLVLTDPDVGLNLQLARRAAEIWKHGTIHFPAVRKT